MIGAEDPFADGKQGRVLVAGQGRVQGLAPVLTHHRLGTILLDNRTAPAGFMSGRSREGRCLSGSDTGDEAASAQQARAMVMQTEAVALLARAEGMREDSACQ